MAKEFLKFSIFQSVSTCYVTLTEVPENIYILSYYQVRLSKVNDNSQINTSETNNEESRQ